MLRIRKAEADRRGNGVVVAPRQRNGRPYPLVMLEPDAYLYATQPAELLATLIPGYAELSRHDRLDERIEHAARVRSELTAESLARHWDVPLTEAERAVLCSSPWEPPVLRTWRHPVPVVLLDVFYAPFTDTPPPDYAANVVWLRPSREEPYIHSLAERGLISLATAA